MVELYINKLVLTVLTMKKNVWLSVEKAGVTRKKKAYHQEFVVDQFYNKFTIQNGSPSKIKDGVKLLKQQKSRSVTSRYPGGMQWI